MKAVVSVLLLVSLLGSAQDARADEAVTRKVEALYAEGVALFKAAKYRAAIKRFRAAHKLYADPVLLYNIGRSQEALGEIDEALKTYRRCSRHPKVSAAIKAKAKGRSATLEKVKKATAAAPDDPISPAVTPAGPAGGAGAAAATPAVSPPAPKTSALTISKWVVGGVGAALLVAGGVALGMGQADHGEIDDGKSSPTSSLTRARAIELKDSGDSKKMVGYILFGVGGAAIVGATVMFLLDGKGEAEKQSAAKPGLRFSAAASPQGASLLLSGTF
jgi:tetratricopeptide (TPR) repeat protein